ncbi:MAG: hypothetical protein K2K11_01475 [Bacteroidales bacterium]|nr:hypothetical protein [Bacteroidales bacterium]MDE7338912.1 hypothetical protein [Bacteroidales bacterium]
MKREKYKKKVLPETATIANDSVSTKKATAISSNTHANASTVEVAITPADAMAKIMKNLDFLIKLYHSQSRTRGFLTDLSQALCLRERGASHYRDFTFSNGSKVTIRISNHNAKVSNFDKHNEPEGLSIVISSYANKKITNDGSAHVKEYFYPRKKIEAAPNNPLSTITLSVKNLLLTGEYKDLTKLAEPQEVNAPKHREKKDMD